MSWSRRVSVRAGGRLLVVAVLAVVSLVVVVQPVGAVPTAAASPNEAFVTAVYHDVLGRAPDAAGLAHWSSFLDGGGSRAAFVDGIVFSHEWAASTVTGLYHDVLGRAPDATGLGFWSGELGPGTMMLAQLVGYFYGSHEYVAANGPDAGAWVASVYSKMLGREPSSAAVGYWAGRVAAEGRVAVAEDLFRSHEVRVDRVDALYEQLLHRPADTGGEAYWAGVMVARGERAVIVGLATTAEYYRDAQRRFGAPPAAVPGAPTGVVATAGDAQVSVRWTAPGSDGGSPVTGYTATAAPGGAACSTAGATSCVISGLTNGTSYTVTVKATNAVGTGPASAPSTAVTPSAPFAIYKGTQAPLYWAPAGMNASGLIVGTADSNGGQGVACQAPCDDPNGLVLLKRPPGISQLVIDGVNDRGVIYGQGLHVGDGIQPAAYWGVVWQSVDAKPTVLPEPALPRQQVVDLSLVGVSSSGVIVGSIPEVGAFYWLSPTSAPLKLANAPGVPKAAVTLASAVAADGTIVGYGPTAASPDVAQGLVWSTPTVTPTLLPADAGDGPVRPFAISHSGAIAGIAYPPNQTTSVPVLWSSADATTMTTLKTPSGSSDVTPRLFGPDGSIVGYDPASSDSLVWQGPDPADATPVVLPTPPGAVSSRATGMGAARNDGQQLLVGWSKSGPGASDVLRQGPGVAKPLRWSAPSSDATVDDLPSPVGTCDEITLDVAEGGSAVGLCPYRGVFSSGVPSAPVAWSSPYAPPAPLQTPADMTAVTPLAASPKGEIVGYGLTSAANHPLMWASATSAPVELKVPSTVTDAKAIGVSDSGVIVGSGIDGSASRVLIWTSPSAVATEVPLPAGVDGMFPIGISDAGVIVANGLDTDDHFWGYAMADPTAPPSKLPAPTGFTGQDLKVTAFSGAGAIVGYGQASDGTFQPLLWPATAGAPVGPPISLQVPLGSGLDRLLPTGVSDSGHVVGLDVLGSYGLIYEQWSSPTAAPTEFHAPAGYSTLGQLAGRDFLAERPSLLFGVTASGKLHGELRDDATGRLVGFLLTP